MRLTAKVGYVAAGALLVGCGARSGLDLLGTAMEGSSADAGLSDGNGGVTVPEAGGGVDGGAGDSGAADATGDTRSSFDGPSLMDVDAAEGGGGGVAISACLGSANAVVVQDSDNPNLNINSQQLVWSVVAEDAYEVELSVHDNVSGTDWTFYFATAKESGGLGPGTYDDAGETLSATQPAIDIGGNGGGCDQAGGDFRIYAFDADDAGVSALAVTFDQWCMGAELDLAGCLHLSR